MGACGYFLSSRSVFLVTFHPGDPDIVGAGADPRARDRHRAGPWRVKREVPDARATSVLGLVRQRSLLIFAGAMMLFQFANAAMLPLMAGVVTTRSSQWAPVLIAACIIVPQRSSRCAHHRSAASAGLGRRPAAPDRVRLAGDPRPPVRDGARP